jgi:NTP pyrophosphatase (non-canonical NTP hydrolase)
LKISEAQQRIGESFGEKDKARGVAGTFMYLVEEVGELSTALREETKAERAAELADVLAWTLSIAELEGVDLERAFTDKYLKCPGCGLLKCECDSKP